jgi:two-component system response regulator HydG
MRRHCRRAGPAVLGIPSSRVDATSASLPPPPAEREAPPIHVLVVDDEEPLRRVVARMLTGRGYRVDTAPDGPAALEFLETHDPDVVLSDLQMPGMTGIELLARAKALHPTLPVVIMTAFADVAAAVEALRSGAYHFLTKPFHSTDAVALAISNAAEHRRLVDHARSLEQRLASEGRFGEIIGDAPKMQVLYRMIQEVAPTPTTVLVLGESGTGKELVARSIHERSPRAPRPFVAVNCGAIAPEMIESEMFGHVRGAFTGAHASRAGLFQSASGGTLLLDEVGDLPLGAQVKVLRALQEGEIRPVGSDETRIVDVRVIAATNVDLATRLEAGTFRRDLYYRLNVFPLELPPLRERPDDAALLAAYFLRKIAKRIGKKEKRLSPDALAAVRAHPWPGNVRELENAMERACILARTEEIRAIDFPFARALVPSDVPRASPAPAAPRDSDLFDLPYAEAKRRSLERFEREYVRGVTERAGGNASEAARLAGLDRSNFRRIQRRVSR